MRLLFLLCIIVFALSIDGLAPANLQEPLQDSDATDVPKKKSRTSRLVKKLKKGVRSVKKTAGKGVGKVKEGASNLFSRKDKADRNKAVVTNAHDTIEWQVAEAKAVPESS